MRAYTRILLDGCRVVLNPIRRTRRTFLVVKREGEFLDVTEELGAKKQHEFFRQ